MRSKDIVKGLDQPLTGLQNVFISRKRHIYAAFDSARDLSSLVQEIMQCFFTVRETASRRQVVEVKYFVVHAPRRKRAVETVDHAYINECDAIGIPNRNIKPTLIG